LLEPIEVIVFKTFYEILPNSDSLAKNASCKDPILPQLGLHSMLLIQFLLIEDAQNLFMRKDASNSYSRDGKAKVIKAIGLLETLKSVSLCYELHFKQF